MTIYRETSTPRAWCAIINMAGYMPESEGCVTSSPEFAREYLRDELERLWDMSDDSDLIEQGYKPADIREAIEYIAESTDDEGLTYIDYRSGYLAYSWHELPASDFEVCEDCGTIADPYEGRCWCCGNARTVLASDYDTTRPRAITWRKNR